MLTILSRLKLPATFSIFSLKITLHTKTTPYVVNTILVQTETMGVVRLVDELLYIGSQTTIDQSSPILLFGQLFEESLCFLFSQGSHWKAGE